MLPGSVSNLSRTQTSTPNLEITSKGETERQTNREETLGAHSSSATTRPHARSSGKLETGRTVWTKGRRRGPSCSISISTATSRLPFRLATSQRPPKPTPPTAWPSSPKTTPPTRCSRFRSSWNASRRKWSRCARPSSISLACCQGPTKRGHRRWPSTRTT